MKSWGKATDAQNAKQKSTSPTTRPPLPSTEKKGNTVKYGEIDWAKLVHFGKLLVGKPYVFGKEINIKNVVEKKDPNLVEAIDCSELVELLYALINIYIEDGSYNQAKYTYAIPKESVKVGDLGFKADPETGVIHHVGVYVGENLVLEAKGKKWGVVLTPKQDYEASTHFLKWGRHKIIEQEAV